MTQTEASNLADRFRGALIGTAVGDALGAPVEGHRSVPSTYLDSILDDPPNLSYTDDTAMTFGVAESLVARDGFDGAHMAEAMADRYGKEPWRGYGSGPPRVFARLARGIPWDQAATHLFEGEGSYGNGAAMRVAPVALYAHPSLDRTAEIARQSATITHTHPVGIDGAVMQAVAVAALLSTTTSDSLTDLPRLVTSHVETAVFRDKLRFIDRHAGIRPIDELAATLGTGIAADASVPTALACFLTHPDDFAAAVTAAISLGGDTDTIAAMTGALSGAYHGYTSIPGAWQVVEGADELIALADLLVGRRQRR